MTAEPRSAAMPIIVVGINRSGTKWLSNEIAAHPGVAAVQAEIHGGIVESNMFTDFGRGFDLGIDEEYERFLAFWARTHFFQLAGGDIGSFRDIRNRPVNSVDALRLLMESYAARLDKQFWLQKVAPGDAESTLSFLPDAKVVAIERSAVATARSRIRLDAGRGVTTRPIRAGMSQGVQMRQLDRLLQRREALKVSYESLVEDRRGVLRGIFDFVGLEPSDAKSPFAPNTSFNNHGERGEALRSGGEIIVGFAVAFCGVVPMPVLERLQRRLTRGRPDVIPGTFAHEEAS